MSLLALSLPFCDGRCLSSQDLILEINELRYRMTELESEKLQYEKKLKSTKVSFQKVCTPGVYLKTNMVFCPAFFQIHLFRPNKPFLFCFVGNISGC